MPSQSVAPVTSVFPADSEFCLLEIGIQADPAFAISHGSRDASPLTPGHDRRFLTCCCSFHLSDLGKPLDPRPSFEFLPAAPGIQQSASRRISLLGHPVPAEELSPPHGRPTEPESGPRRGYRVPHARAATGVGALCTPGTAVLIPAGWAPQPAPAASQRPVPAPRRTSHRQGSRFTRHQRGFKQFARPVFPSPVAARMERAALGLSPGLRTPPTKARTTHAGEGTGHRAPTWNYTLNSHQSISNPVVHSQRATSRRAPKSERRARRPPMPGLRRTRARGLPERRRLPPWHKQMTRSGGSDDSHGRKPWWRSERRYWGASSPRCRARKRRCWRTLGTARHSRLRPRAEQVALSS